MEVLLYRNQSIDLQSKLMDWFLYDRDFRYERVKEKLKLYISATKDSCFQFAVFLQFSIKVNISQVVV